MTTVIGIIKDFVNSNNIVDGLNINPVENYKGDDRRRNLYTSYINKLFPEFPEWKKVWNPLDKRILLRKKT